MQPNITDVGDHALPCPGKLIHCTAILLAENAADCFLNTSSIAFHGFDGFALAIKGHIAVLNNIAGLGRNNAQFLEAFIFACYGIFHGFNGLKHRDAHRRRSIA
ncbi:hypothetical protein DEA98_06930 [Brucella pseudogrignonensis]|nr:hypothetical protein [Brucella pseudogrignonensis]